LRCWISWSWWLKRYSRMKREGVKRESLIAEGLPTEAKLVQFVAKKGEENGHCCVR
jgi:hypothetical protein